MRETSYHAVIAEMTVRALWELQNLLDCIPDALWDRCYGGAPLWQHVYSKNSSSIEMSNTNVLAKLSILTSFKAYNVSLT